MTDAVPIRPIRWNAPRVDELEHVVRECAADTTRIAVHPHAYERVDERGIIEPEMFDILRTGYVSDDIEKMPKGDWKIKVIKKIKGNREAAVVAIIIKEGKYLFVRTIMWID